MRLGERLCRLGHMSQDDLSKTLDLQKRRGGRLGDIIISEGIANYRALYETLAEHSQLPYVDLQAFPPDPKVLAAGDIDTYLLLGAIPWRQENGSVFVAVCELSEAVKIWAQKTFGGEVCFVTTSPFDIRRAIETAYSGALERRSRLALWHRQPSASARSTLPKGQQQILVMLTVTVLLGLIHAPMHTCMYILVFCNLVYTATMAFKILIFAAGTQAPRQKQETLPEHIDDRELPIYTVLVPMYKEASSVPGLLESLKKLDYPSSKLDIKLVLESHDHETLEAAQKLNPGYHFDIIRVPPSPLRTKPKACNYALRFARGEYVTVFDADDRPEPQQLKKAVIMFRSLPKDVACLQARLNYYNAHDNLLTRFFSLEYKILFYYMLYGLERLGIPIPLGGTSNHIAIARLIELGEWDPYNVTEDADLGIRIAARGYKTHMLDSVTMEEAPNRIAPWLRQRSRWIKGYMQTWLVHMRKPKMLYKKLGVRGFIGFQFFIGLSCFTFLSAPVVWLVSLLWAGKMVDLHNVYLPSWLGWLTALNLSLTFLTHWYLSVYSALRYSSFHIPSMMVAALLFPLYFVLHTVASYKALLQLIYRPHFWEKTAHGLARGMEWLIFERDRAKMAINAVDSRA